MAYELKPFTPSMKHNERERWICIYPAYLNSKKTVAQGRKLPKERCVDNPTYQEIRDVLAVAGLPVAVEDKSYSREKSKEIMYRCRVRVQIKNEDSTLVNEKFPNRLSVMMHAAKMIPSLKTRHSKPGDHQSQTGGKGKGKGKSKK